MAMKFDNLIKINITLLIIGLLTACASNKVVKPVGLLKPTTGPLDLRSTVQYIPQRSKNAETGMLEPYIPQVNPYTVETGRIDAESVKTFIAAKRAIQGSELENAKQLLTQITETDKKLSGPWVLLGDIAKKQKDLEGAVEHYKKAVEINRNNINAYLRLAKLQREMGKFIESQNSYSWALSRWRDFPEAHLNLAVLYDIYLNKPLKAQRHLEAYQFLTSGRDSVRADWLKEIQQRTGEEIVLHVEKKKASTLAASNP